MALVLTGIVSYTKLNVADPIAVGVDAAGLTWLAPIVKIGAILGLTSVILVMLMGQPRIFYSMAHDGLLAALGREDPPALPHALRHDHRHRCGGGDRRRLHCPSASSASLTSIGTLFAFVLVCIGVPILRMRDPAAARPFKTPAVWVVSSLGVVSCLALMIPLGIPTWIRLTGWMAIGFVIYFMYGKNHSKLRAATAAAAK